MQTVNFVFSFLYYAADKAKKTIEQAITAVAKNGFGLFNLWLHKAWRGERVANSNVVVVLTAAHDHNGALSVPHISTTCRLHSHSEIQIIYRKVSSLEGIEKELGQIKAQNNQIKGLWINAHGVSHGFELGKKIYVSNRFGNSRDGLQRALDKLDADASIILSSCLTGKIASHGLPSIAQTIAELAPHRRVYAPIQSINGAALHFRWDKDNITAHFTAPKKAGFFYQLAHVLSFGYYGQNVTAIVKSYP